MVHAYPEDLARLVYDRLVAEDNDVLPDLDVLSELLSVAYQASLLREEERPTTFRLVFAPRGRFTDDGGPPMKLHRLLFAEGRPFTADELRRLSQAAKFQRSLIGVGRRDGRLEAWGILHSGPAWLRAIQGGRGLTPEAPSVLTIAVAGPGRLTVGYGGKTFAQLAGGRISQKTQDIFASQWLPGMFSAVRSEVTAIHEKEHEDSWSQVDPDIIRMIGQHFVRRIVATIRVARHGGTLLFLPASHADEIASGPHVKMKVRFVDAEPRRRFRSLLLSAMRALAAQGDPVRRNDTVGWDTYNRTRDESIANVDEAIFELSHLIAGLADVDGAVVLTTRFEILGFGAELAGELPEISHVARATDLEGTHIDIERADGVGTRHRSMYRMAARYPELLGIVVSQDGGVRFVKRHGPHVTYWDQGATGSLDI